MSPHIPFFDFDAILVAQDYTLAQAITKLNEVYQALEPRLEDLQKKHSLPCHAGCSQCCHQAVFITPLEWWFMVNHIQQTKSQAYLQFVIERAETIYRDHRETIEGFLKAPNSNEYDHWDSAKQLSFQCPFLQDDHCGIYPARSLNARLFGCSFQSPGVVYACGLVEQALAQQTVNLLYAPKWNNRLAELPLTDARQVIPYYIMVSYGNYTKTK